MFPRPCNLFNSSTSMLSRPCNILRTAVISKRMRVSSAAMGKAHEAQVALGYLGLPAA